MNVLETFLQILAQPGGQAVLLKLFADHNIPVEKLQAILAGLKDPPKPGA